MPRPCLAIRLSIVMIGSPDPEGRAMLTLPMTKAAAGMTLAMPVLHPEKPGHVLLKPGCVLDDRAVGRLRELGVRRIAIEYPPTAFLMRYASVGLINAQSRVAERIADEMDAMSTGLHADFELQTYVDGVRLLIQHLVDEPAAALFMNDIVDARASVASHAFNVGLLSLLLGLKLDGYLVSNRTRITRRRQMNIESLGLGAMLHDIGITRLPKTVGDRFDRSRDESDEQWRKHVLVGFALVKGRLPATASATVLHHHQRMDGSGFPTRTRGFGPPTALRGEEIHIFARIVGLADAFDRFRNPRGAEATPQNLGQLHGGPVPTVRALKQTLEQVRAGKLDHVVFKALLMVVPAFPPGSIVKISDGRTCVVTGWEPTQPCSPTVSVLPASLEEALAEGGGRILKDAEPLGEEIDLADRRDLRIVSIDGQDVTEDQFEPLNSSEFDLRLAFSTPIGDGWDHIVEQTLAAGGKIG
jgi:HD-GYP domain-containing protein (c-di-GMP phosphodiesterase class II)